jgi:hypothetical protein
LSSAVILFEGNAMIVTGEHQRFGVRCAISSRPDDEEGWGGPFTLLRAEQRSLLSYETAAEGRVTLLLDDGRSAMAWALLHEPGGDRLRGRGLWPGVRAPVPRAANRGSYGVRSMHRARSSVGCE